ncbi:MAG: methyltransferase domain-containing protein [Candidatus Omnitrophota bacterium]|nr:methyltransferase domain-containing protein [Candidatus Omnitrophota bacterium]
MSNFQSERGHVEKEVKARYTKGAARVEAALCCPVDYDPQYLRVIPKEILDKDYGCGDPSRYLREGDIVLDLGSGAGKICYIASQIVGRKGRVIGVDFNQAMLQLARKHQRRVAKRIGWDNIDFRWGRIQDLKTDPALLEKKLRKRPIRSAAEYLDFDHAASGMWKKNPLVADDSVDVIVSNCVLNLVHAVDKMQLFREMFRVLKRGGRIAISDIVSDESVPSHLQNDPELWSGCISGAFEEKAFIQAFQDAGFYGIQIERRDEEPWQTVEGIEFRSVTVTAHKGKEGECWERNQAVIYKGPWRRVEDDDGHVLDRGVRIAVCDKTFNIYTRAPYAGDVLAVTPRKLIPLSKAKPFDCSPNTERHAKETKGQKYQETVKNESVCLDGGCC